MTTTGSRAIRNGEGIQFGGYSRSRDHRLGDRARFQRASTMDSVCGREPHRAEQASDQIGCIRNFRLKDGGRIREQLLSLSDYEMSFEYSILESPMGVENYVATFRLIPVTDSDQTFAEWTAEFDAAPDREDGLVESVGRNVFAAGLQALKMRFNR
jgi:hypothetical protein